MQRFHLGMTCAYHSHQFDQTDSGILFVRLFHKATIISLPRSGPQNLKNRLLRSNRGGQIFNDPRGGCNHWINSRRKNHVSVELCRVAQQGFS